MPWLPFYVTEEDKPTLLSWLNAEDEIAFLVSTAQSRWKAVKTLNSLPDGTYALWHVPSGPLPLFVTESGMDEIDGELEKWQGTRQVGFIDNPWAGWTEQRRGWIAQEPKRNSDVPYFGAGWPGVIWLSVHVRREDYSEGRIDPVTGEFITEQVILVEDLLNLSDFGWITKYRVPPAQTRDWWERLKRWVAQEAKLLVDFPAQEDDGDLIEEWGFWAFPHAYQAMKNGMAYLSNGFDLSQGLR